MKTLAKTESGKILEITEMYTPTKSDFRGKLQINGDEVHANWFVKESGKVTFVSDDFVINGQTYRAKGEVIKFSKELQEFVQWYLNDIKKERKQKYNDLISQS